MTSPTASPSPSPSLEKRLAQLERLGDLRDRLATTFDVEGFAHEVALFFHESFEPRPTSVRVLVFHEGNWLEHATIREEQSDTAAPSPLFPIDHSSLTIASNEAHVIDGTRVIVSLAPSDQSLAMVMVLDHRPEDAERLDVSALAAIRDAAAIVRRQAQTMQIVLGLTRDQQEDLTALLRELDEHRKRDVVLVTRTTELEAKEAALGADLQQAARIQRAMFGDAPEVDGATVLVWYRPLDEVGGDLYDVIVDRDNRRRLRLFVADATGHGVTAALITMFIKGEYAAIRGAASDPADVLHRLNQRVLATQLEIRFTAVCLDLDLDARVMKYAVAAHPAIHVLSKDATLRELDGEVGTFVGLHAKATYTNHVHDLRPGDSIFVTTDGLFDAIDTTGSARLGDDFVHSTFARLGEAPTTDLSMLFDQQKVSFVDDVLIIGVTLNS